METVIQHKHNTILNPHAILAQSRHPSALGGRSLPEYIEQGPDPGRSCSPIALGLRDCTEIRNPGIYEPIYIFYKICANSGYSIRFSPIDK